MTADPNSDDDLKSTPASPYGPHPEGIDESSGGADSSPFENLSSDERAAALAVANTVKHRQATNGAGEDRKDSEDDASGMRNEANK